MRIASFTLFGIGAVLVVLCALGMPIDYSFGIGTVALAFVALGLSLDVPSGKTSARR